MIKLSINEQFDNYASHLYTAVQNEARENSKQQPRRVKTSENG